MLTQPIRDKIIDAVKLGARLADAARAVGFSPEQAKAWLKEDAEFEKEYRKAKSECKVKQLERLSGAKGWQAPVFLLERKWPKEFGRRRPMPVSESEPRKPDGSHEKVDFSDMTDEEMARLEGCFRKPRLLASSTIEIATVTHGGFSKPECSPESSGGDAGGNDQGTGI